MFTKNQKLTNSIGLFLRNQAQQRTLQSRVRLPTYSSTSLLPASQQIKFFSTSNNSSENQNQNDDQKDDQSEKKTTKSSSSKFQRSYKKPDFLDDEYDHLSRQAPKEAQQRSVEDEDFLPDYLEKDAPTYKRNEVQINMPWLINGAPFNELKTRFMGEQVYSRMKVHKVEVLEHLFKVYRAVLLAAQDKDFDFLEEYCEEMFYTKLRNRLNQLKAQDLTLTVSEDMFADRGKPMQVEANMYDHVVIKGLSAVRKENGAEDDYYIFNDIENMGLISYVPKYIANPENFADPVKNKEIHSEAHKVVYRCYITFKTGYKLYLKDKYGKDQFVYPPNDEYTWQHVGVFETSMEPPGKFTKWSGSENLMEWIGRHEFGTWKMVDLDNWLVGNPLVIPKYDVRKRTAVGGVDIFSETMMPDNQEKKERAPKTPPRKSTKMNL